MEEIRFLTKDDIETRVAHTDTYTNDDGSTTTKVTLLLYKNARVDMKILDELFTPMGWRRTHKLIGDRLYCSVEVYDAAKKEWISKEDVGVESNTEAEKGQASDAFKRACVNWGIGRELYSAPKISFELNSKEFSKDRSGRIKLFSTYHVKHIGYDTTSRTITSLEIVDRFGNVRYTMGLNNIAPIQTSATPAYQPLPEDKYWANVKAHALGQKTPKGGSIRELWIKKTHADREAIAKFDHDVENVQLAHGIIQ